jgi:mannose-6-phosphate isomerase-like protein (cupin superfamily)
VPADQSKASDTASVIAPDGIAIHTFDLQGDAFTGIAEGRIPPGRFAIHRHLMIEQFTYVLAGAVTARVGSLESDRQRSLLLEEGDLLLTKPGESLEFVNSTAGVTRVLFICTPPYPADDSDTRILQAHVPPSRDELITAMRRLEALRQHFNQDLDRRLAELLSRVAG